VDSIGKPSRPDPVSQLRIRGIHAQATQEKMAILPYGPYQGCSFKECPNVFLWVEASHQAH
jgi:hypothetical protein